MNKEEFWVINISNRNVVLADLNVTINAYCTVNLLSKHYYYTLAQLKKSVESGSIFKKRDKIILGKGKPEVFKLNTVHLQESFIPNRQRSLLEIEHKHYEELNVSDEDFANENAELAEQDRMQNLIKKI